MRKVFTTPKYAELHDFVASLPERFENNEGKIIYDGRNQLREFTVNGIDIVVKSFAIPSLLNQVAYGFLRSSKAQRSCEYAQLLLDNGIGSPAPIGYVTTRKRLLFDRSFYACIKSENCYNYDDICKFEKGRRRKFIEAVAQTTAQLHECGILHLDYSAGNLLIGEKEDGQVNVEVIDLNRIRFKKINLDTGCRNFDRLPMDEDIIRTLGENYAKARNFNVEQCICRIRETYRYKL